MLEQNQRLPSQGDYGLPSMPAHTEDPYAQQELPRWHHWILLLVLTAAFLFGLAIAVVVGFIVYGLVTHQPQAVFEQSMENAATLAGELGFAVAVLVLGPFRRLAAPLWRMRMAHLGKWLLAGFFGILAVKIGGVAIGALTALFGGMIEQPEAQQAVHAASKMGGVQMLLLILGMVVAAPLAEEYLFRGALFAGLRQRWPFWAAALLSSGLFGLMHYLSSIGTASVIGLMVDLTFLGFVNAYLVERTKSLWPAIFVHFINNLMAVLFMTVWT